MSTDPSMPYIPEEGDLLPFPISNQFPYAETWRQRCRPCIGRYSIQDMCEINDRSALINFFKFYSEPYTNPPPHTPFTPIVTPLSSLERHYCKCMTMVLFFRLNLK